MLPNEYIEFTPKSWLSIKINILSPITETGYTVSGLVWRGTRVPDADLVWRDGKTQTTELINYTIEKENE